MGLVLAPKLYIYIFASTEFLIFATTEMDMDEIISYEQAFLAYCYHSGNGVAQDYLKAMQWILIAANQGYKIAAGEMFYFGQGVDQDFGKTMYWCKLAAENGNTMAKYLMGKLYHEGKGFEPDLEQYIRLTKETALTGHASSQYSLGLFYLREQKPLRSKAGNFRYSIVALL